jgi:hypothetical protein
MNLEELLSNYLKKQNKKINKIYSLISYIIYCAQILADP